MFVNLSNHPSKDWSSEQLLAANVYGTVIDVPFPVISPEEDDAFIASWVTDYVEMINSQYDPAQDVFHVMGEMCFSYALVNRLQKMGFICLASTSERIVKEMEPGRKEVFFKFVRFRKYGG